MIIIARHFAGYHTVDVNPRNIFLALDIEATSQTYRARKYREKFQKRNERNITTKIAASIKKSLATECDARTKEARKWPTNIWLQGAEMKE